MRASPPFRLGANTGICGKAEDHFTAGFAIKPISGRGKLGAIVLP
jgi:hypothetical protein